MKTNWMLYNEKQLIHKSSSNFILLDLSYTPIPGKYRNILLTNLYIFPLGYIQFIILRIDPSNVDKWGERKILTIRQMKLLSEYYLPF